MKLIWKATAAAVIGWACSVAYDGFQEWGTPAQYWQDLWYGKAESEVPDPLKAQVEARKQQAVERDNWGLE